MTRRRFVALGAGGLAAALAACSRPARPRRQVFNSEARPWPADAPRAVFTDVTREAGIDFVHSRGPRTHQLPEDMGSGAAWGDFDNDGYPDLYLVNQPGPWGRPAGPNPPAGKLYRNNRDGTFTDVTERAGVANRGGFGMGAAWGDYDNDGRLDLYVTNYGRSVLYHNNGDGTFSDVTDRAGVGNHRWGMSALWFDFDNDGYLDLYVANYVDYALAAASSASSRENGLAVPFSLNPASFAPAPNRLYRTNRDGTFTDVATELGVADPEGRGLAAAFADFRLRGWQDLYVANDISSNQLFENLGRGRFRNVSAASWTEEYRGTMGIAVGDFDGDGDLDMFLSHWTAQGDALYQNLWSEQSRQGALHFHDAASLYGLDSISYSDAGWGAFFFDFDNDGRLDLLVVNGSTFEQKADSTLLIPERPLLLWNGGDRGFFDLAAAGRAGAALALPDNARGAACADYNRDGRLDVVITSNHGRARLLRNDGETRNHWLCVHLVGSRANRQGIGARLTLAAGGRRYLAQYGLQGSYLSCSAPECWFGLGAASRVDSLAILWPSQKRQELRDLPVDRVITIQEDGSAWS